ncbi:hypothetical protein BCR34DRAFT_498364 [Clohesyomyces aquaticus]|uniref:Uncharacterized protein n=1 Tax=Clohesyomyces aquaticus TaxID=1231657 RepID=A0A1Y1YC85_9PLEO|nr:hypothetical protein BCR34DRAFT_498364 [Clohesyomyces aquaticus]
MAPLSPLPPNTSPLIRTTPSWCPVIYHLSTSPSNTKTTIKLPRGSQWTSGPHFHTQSTEYLRLIRGAIFVNLETSTKILSRSTENAEEEIVVEILPYMRHEWDLLPGEDYDAVVEEWTVPQSISKPLFFWNICGILHPTTATTMKRVRELPARQKFVKRVIGDDNWMTLQLFVVFWKLDNWPVLVDICATPSELHLGQTAGVAVQHGIEYAWTVFVLMVAAIIGWMIGLEAVSEDRTPRDLWEAWKQHGVRLVEKKE